MYSRDIQSLLRVKQVIDHLKVLDTTTLTETERNTVQDCLQQAYNRAVYVLQVERAPIDDSTTNTGPRSCST